MPGDQLISLIVHTDDEYKYLVNGLYRCSTNKENGVKALLVEAEGWSKTILEHTVGDILKSSDFGLK